MSLETGKNLGFQVIPPHQILLQLVLVHSLVHIILEAFLHFILLQHHQLESPGLKTHLELFLFQQ